MQQTLLSINQERLKIIQKRVEVGTANQTDLSLAQLDVSNQEQMIRSQELAIRQAKIQLNLLLAQNADTPLEIKENITLKENLQIENLKSNLEQNPQLEIARNNLKNSLTFEKEAKAQKMPSLTISAGYSYNRNNSTAGFLLLNQNYGAFVGFNLAVPLYNGNIFDRQYQTAQLQSKIARIGIQPHKARNSNGTGTPMAKLSHSQRAVSDRNCQLSECPRVSQNYGKAFCTGGKLLSLKFVRLNELPNKPKNRKIQSFFNVKLAEIQLLLVAGKIENPLKRFR
ncbi:MAG: hypothetical protein KatS3mg028_1237 [Bacteroidia bacterium]|nr:MAG: hypothetical protein KatS3mg028_1237 [Bacteroidia bacterium]